MITRIRFKASRNASVDPAEDQVFDVDTLTVGRASSSDLRLRRVGLRYHHAKLRLAPEGVTVEAEIGAALGPAGQPISSVTLQGAGDEVRIGPYLLKLDTPAADSDDDWVLLITYDQESPFDQGKRVGEIVARFSVGLPNIRLWAFSLSVVVFLLCFLIPLVMLPTTQTEPWMTRHGHAAADQAAKTISARVANNWSVGSFSNGHATFSANCAACHEGDFIRVRESACLECHQGQGQHVDPKPSALHPQGMPAADVRSLNCADCHREHRGPTLISTDDNLNCINCHGDLHQKAPDTKFQDVTDFGRNHPRFSPAMVQDAKGRVMSRFVTGDPKAIDNSNVTFDHAKHLKKWFKDPKQPWDGAAKAAAAGSDCAACHMPAGNGQYFKEVTFEDACVSCHKLQFEPKHPEWQLPHGRPDEIVSRVTGYYARAAMDGERFVAPSDDLFKIPDKLMPPPPDHTDPISAQVEATMVVSIAGSACGECHKVLPPMPPLAPTEWRVAPVYDPDHYLTKTRFHHEKHSTMRCQDCHAAEASDEGAMALLPDIETCRTCHSSQAAARLRVDSRCTDCHVFHNPDLPVLGKPGSIFPQAASAVPIIGSGELK